MISTLWNRMLDALQPVALDYGREIALTMCALMAVLAFAMLVIWLQDRRYRRQRRSL